MEEMGYIFTGWINEMLCELLAHMLYSCNKYVLSTTACKALTIDSRDIVEPNRKKNSTYMELTVQ